MKKRETRVANMHLLDEGMVYVAYKDNVQVKKKDAEEMMEALSCMVSGTCPRIYRYNRDISFDIDAIKTLATSQTANAIAIVSDSSQPTAILDGIKKYFRTFKYNFPIRYFYDKSQAIDWAKQYVNSDGS